MSARILMAVPMFAVLLGACSPYSAPVMASRSSPAASSLHGSGFGDTPYFKKRSADVDASAQAALVLVAKIALKENVSLKIIGRSDNCDVEAANLALSQLRASAVKNELLARGVPEDLIVSVSGTGSSKESVGSEPCSRPHNDRVDIEAKL